MEDKNAPKDEDIHHKAPNDEDIQKQIAELREWLEQKPYVPKNIDERLYRRFIHSCYYDMDRAKTAADLFFSIRSSAPELLTDRDPLSPHMQKAMKITKFGMYRLSRKRNLWLWQLDDPGLQQYDHLLEAKVFILVGDAWLLEDDFLAEEDIAVTDIKDLSFRMFTKFSFAVAKKLSKYQQEALPARLQQIHMINAPRIMNRIFAFMKPFMGKDIMKMIHIHTPNSTTLFDHFDRDEMPEDFGGTRGKLSEYAAEVVGTVIKHREKLIDDNFWRIDASTCKKEKEKVNTKPVTAKTSEINSLRNLDID